MGVTLAFAPASALFPRTMPRSLAGRAARSSPAFGVGSLRASPAGGILLSRRKSSQREMKRRLQSGYNRKSLGALAVMILVGTAVGCRWGDLLRQNAEDINWLLLATWAAMTALLCWEVQPVRDMALGSVALAGGLGFEWWGTHTGLWAYFTGEKPPAWILPAWPVAALANQADRLGAGAGLVAAGSEVAGSILAVHGCVCRRHGPLLLACDPQPAHSGGLGVDGGGDRERADAKKRCLPVRGRERFGRRAGYWGTSRNCWTYHTLETPPPIAVAAHGFAQIVYARALSGLGWSLSRLGLGRSIQAGELA